MRIAIGLCTAALLALPAQLHAGTATLDPGFGNAGVATVPFNVAPGSNQPRSVFINQAGELFVGGDTLAKYTSSGALDSSFGGGDGASFVDLRISGIVGQPDGKLVLAGDIALGSGGVNFAVGRVLADGTLDSTFGTGGKTNFTIASTALDVALQSDGKIVVVGRDLAQRRFLIARFNTDGTLDQSFGDAGVINEEVGGFDSTARSVVVLDDGKILVFGEVANQAGEDPECFDDADVAVVRYLTNGTRDTTFGTGGVSFLDLANCDDEAAQMLLQSDGKILLAGHATIPSASSNDEDFYLARLLANGSLDTTFGSNGLVFTDFVGRDDEAAGAALQGDGKIVFFGEASLNTSDELRVLRFNTDGSLDTAFGNQGSVTVTAEGSNESDCCVALAPTGEIVSVFSTNQPETSSDYGVVRVTSAGVVDGSFGTQGVVTSDFPLRRQSFSTDLFRQADGKLVQTGYTDRFALARYNSNGSLDTGFGDAGVVLSDLVVGKEEAKAGLVQPDGKIVVLGDNNGETIVARYLSDGSLDPAFGTGGFTAVALRTIAGDVALQSDGKIVAGGTGRTSGVDFAFLRLNTDGSLDPTFGTAGIVELDRDGGNDLLTSIVVLSDDRIVGGGHSAATASGDFALLRLSADGVLDATFGVGGWALADLRGGSDKMNALILLASGKLLAAGKSENAGGLISSDFAVARFNADGSLDASFGSGGSTTIDLGSIDEAFDLAEDPSGDIYVVGDVANVGVVRLNAGGDLDTGFSDDGIEISDLFGFEAARSVVIGPMGPLVGGHAITENIIALTAQDFTVRSILAEGCSLCGHPTDLSVCNDPTATDALNALKAAVGQITCELCRCDVNNSGTNTASDALLILQNAVGQPRVLICPVC